ncbi:hypothetical protein L6164_036679 [Bauhinia variegata]|uniref:Uncharacterized protein n=1 Tax=Bauhinia variegata TaxID=167791 RepID=A0ACB9KHT5_BAUVA|nr:hypothetical protein L6164_036679 [Bauhinia variegata]
MAVLFPGCFSLSLAVSFGLSFFPNLPGLHLMHLGRSNLAVTADCNPLQIGKGVCNLFEANRTNQDQRSKIEHGQKEKLEKVSRL